MELLTAYKGKAHLTSMQFRALIESICGSESRIANLDEKMILELAENNTVKIRSGILIHHGAVMQVKRGTYDQITYQNGSQGMKRIDLIVAKYSKSSDTKIEDAEWELIQGEASDSDPAAPTFTEGDMQDGDLIDRCAFAELHFDGINVTEVKQLVPVARNTEELEAELDELNRKLPKVEKNSDGNDIIDTGYSKIAVGTMVTNAIIDSKNQSYAQMFSADQIKRKLNLDTFDFSKFSINVYNGDPNAAYTHLYNVEWWSGIGAYFVYMYPNITGSVRINYRIEYFYM